MVVKFTPTLISLLAAKGTSSSVENLTLKSVDKGEPAAPEPHVQHMCSSRATCFNTCAAPEPHVQHVQLQSHMFNTCAAPEPHVQHMCSSRATCSTHVQLQSHMFNTCAAPEPHVPTHVQLQSQHMCSSRATCSTHVQLQSHM